MIRTKVGCLRRRLRVGVATFLRNLWAQATVPPPPAPLTYRPWPKPGGRGWTKADYDAAKLGREEGWR
jgi:hypothetical protein